LVKREFSKNKKSDNINKKEVFVMLFFCYGKCTTCKRAEKFLKDNGITYTKRDIKTENPGFNELLEIYKKADIHIDKLFNTSGQLYRQLNLKEKLKGMGDEEKLKLLSSDGMLVKRPILLAKDFALVGFSQEKWGQKLLS